MEIVYTLQQLNAVVQQVWQHCQQNKVWLFNANMGCGKTTFINALCNYLQIEQVSSSPTFSIINEYYSPVAGTIYHLDLYRLNDEQEAIQAGVEDVLYSNNYCFVEWPQKAIDLMPNNVCNIYIDIIDNETRQLIIK